jgi:hypothetical protein
MGGADLKTGAACERDLGGRVAGIIGRIGRNVGARHNENKGWKSGMEMLD